MPENRVRRASPPDAPGPTSVGLDPSAEEFSEIEAGTDLSDIASVQPAIASSTAVITAEGKLTISPGATVQESVHTYGHLVVGAQSTLAGAATALEGADIGEGARIDGDLVVTGALRWGAGATAASALVRGPLMTEDDQIRVTALTAPGGIHHVAVGASVVSR